MTQKIHHLNGFLKYFRVQIMYLTLAFVVLGTPEVTHTTSIESAKQKKENKKNF